MGSLGTFGDLLAKAGKVTPEQVKEANKRKVEEIKKEEDKVNSSVQDVFAPEESDAISRLLFDCFNTQGSLWNSRDDIPREFWPSNGGVRYVRQVFEVLQVNPYRDRDVSLYYSLCMSQLTPQTRSMIDAFCNSMQKEPVVLSYYDLSNPFRFEDMDEMQLGITAFSVIASSVKKIPKSSTIGDLLLFSSLISVPSVSKIFPTDLFFAYKKAMGKEWGSCKWDAGKNFSSSRRFVWAIVVRLVACSLGQEGLIEQAASNTIKAMMEELKSLKV